MVLGLGQQSEEMAFCVQTEGPRVGSLQPRRLSRKVAKRFIALSCLKSTKPNSFIIILRIANIEYLAVYHLSWCIFHALSHLSLVLVFCCYITNYHGFSGLKQQMCIVSHFPWIRIPGEALLAPLLGVSARLHSRYWTRCLPVWSPDWGKTQFRPSPGSSGRTRVLVVAGLRSPCSCWLSSQDLLRVLEAAF